MLQCNQQGLDIIRESEGLRLQAYRCPSGIWTIGYGHTGKDVQPDSHITEETAEILLAQDVARVERAATRLVRVPLSINQFSAIVSFVFNIGDNRLIGTRTLAALNRGRYLEFADRLLQWNMGGSPIHELPGLTIRRRKERTLFLKPDMEAL